MANQFLIKNTMADMRGLSASEITSLQGTNPTYAGVELLGYYEKGDTPAPVIYYASNSPLDDNGGNIVVVNNFKLECKFSDKVHALYFGVSKNLADNAGRLSAFFLYLKDSGTVEGILPEGILLYSQTLNFVFENAKLIGQGTNTVLKFIGSGIHAFEIDAFKDGNAMTQFVNNVNIANMVFSGNNSTDITLFVRGIARSIFSNVWVGEGKNITGGYGWYLASVQLSTFNRCGCSKYMTPMDSKPHTGMFLTVGSRGGTTAGNSSNNTFYQNYWEGLSIGLSLAHADNNTFTGGSPEACSVYGMVVGPNSRYNNFTGVGFENQFAIDVSDSGIYSVYTNCYSSDLFRIGSTSLGTSISGGYFQKVEVQSGAVNPELRNSTYYYFNEENGGIVDQSGVLTKWNLKNHQTSLFDKNNLKLSGLVSADSYKVKTKNDILTPINSSDTEGGFSPLLIKDTSFYPNLGVALGVDRTGNFDHTNSISSFRIYSKSNSLSELYFHKKIGANNSSSDWGSLKRFIFDSDVSTPSQNGLVKQSIAIGNCSIPNSTESIVTNAVDLTSALSLVNDLKIKYNQAVGLINELKTQLNAKLQADRSSGQQAN